MKTRISILFLLLAAPLVSACSRPAHARESETWEYKLLPWTEVLNADPFEAVGVGLQSLFDAGNPETHAAVEQFYVKAAGPLNDLGADGWELLLITDGTCVFKRRN